jgi:hypothetical protein
MPFHREAIGPRLIDHGLEEMGQYGGQQGHYHHVICHGLESRASRGVQPSGDGERQQHLFVSPPRQELGHLFGRWRRV